MKSALMLTGLMMISLVTATARAQEGEPAATPQAGEEKHTMVTIKTTQGDIKVELFDDRAPITVENFLGYVDAGHYNGTIFHRVIANFMIQGGGFTKDGVQKPTRAPIRNEAGNGLKNARGTLAMARTSDVDSATSQFFINVVDNAFLDHRNETPGGYGYCVFGKVIEGMEVVEQIRSVKTGSRGPFEDWPEESIEIIEISRSAP